MSLDYYISKSCSYQKFIERTPKNRERLDNVYSSATIPKKYKQQIKEMKSTIRLLVFAENWCSDTVLTIPVLAKLAELNDNIDLLIVPRDDVIEEFKQDFLTEGKAKIPLVLFLLDKTKEVKRWVERTKKTNERIKEIKAQHVKKSEIYRSVVELYLKKGTIDETTKVLACELIKVELIASSSN